MKTADVIVVGAGAIGCSIAWRLAQGGRKVIIIERDTPGAGASSSAGGILGAQLEAKEPGPLADLLMSGRSLYPEFVEELQTEADLDIQFKNVGALRLAFNAEDEQEARRTLEWQRAEGWSVEYLGREEALADEPNLSNSVRGTLLFPNECQVGNRKMMLALATTCQKLGVKIVSGTEVIGFTRTGSRIDGVRTTDGVYSGDIVLIAGGAWSKALGERLGTSLPVWPVRGQMIQLQAASQMFTRLIYHHMTYVVSKPVGRMFVGSTMEEVGFDRSVTAEGIHGILKSVMHISPCISEAEVVDTYSCFRPSTPDGLPIMGKVLDFDNVIAATGHFRNGILLTPITAKLISELILVGRSSISLEPYAPTRFVNAT